MDTQERFSREVYSRNDFRTTVFSFAAAKEDEIYALCRWLRARKYNLSDTIKMVEEATECTAQPRKHDFYPCPMKALAVERSLYIKTYPQLYYGYAKNGCPLFISQPGILDIDSMKSLTSMTSIINYHWYAMMHEYNKKLKEQYEASNGNFKRYECVIILDLAHVSPRKLGKDTMHIIKEMSGIDSLCFPETLNKMIIINAPGFFTLTWKIIKGWIDQRTADKVEVVGTNKTKLSKRLLTIADADNLPIEYGGDGQSVPNFLKQEMIQSFEESDAGSSLKLIDEDNELFYLRGKVSKSITVGEKKLIKISFFTRHTYGGIASVTDSAGNVLGQMNIQHKGSEVEDPNELPTRYNLEDIGVVLKGPDTFTISLVAHSNKRPEIMMAWKEFMLKRPKVVNKPRPQAPRAPSNSACVRTAESICVGTFPKENGSSDYLSVKASPYTERKLAASKKMLPRYNNNNDAIAGVPHVKRITSTAHTNTDKGKYQVCPPSPQRETESFCGLSTACSF